MANDGNGPQRPERPRKGLDPEFLETALEFSHAANLKQSTEPPVPSQDSPGALLEKWRELTDA